MFRKVVKKISGKMPKEPNKTYTPPRSSNHSNGKFYDQT